MDKWLKSTFGIGAAGAFVLIAGNGEKFASSLAAALAFMVALAAQAPLGVWAFLLAVAISVFGQWWFGRFVVAPCAASRTAILAALGFALAAGTMYLQLPTRNGLLLAILAGFASPFLHQCAAAAIGLLRRDKATP